MQVILKESVTGLGHTGEILNVSAGYARNFLFPRNLALVASEKNKQELEHYKKSLALKLAREKNKYLELAKKLKDLTVTIKRKAGENEKLFGSVTSSDVAQNLKEQGFEIDRRQVILSEPIKKLGVTEVEIKFHPEVKGKIKVWVIADAPSEGANAQEAAPSASDLDKKS